MQNTIDRLVKMFINISLVIILSTAIILDSTATICSRSCVKGDTENKKMGDEVEKINSQYKWT